MSYTRAVVSLVHRLIGVGMVVALSGSPAALSACMLFCQHGAAATGGAHAGHGGSAAQAHGHAHHAAPQQTASHAAHAAHAVPSGAPGVPDARIGGVAENCCPNGPIAFTAGPGVERTDVGAVSLVTNVPATTFRSTPASRRTALPVPSVSPPLPAGAPFALRI